MNALAGHNLNVLIRTGFEEEELMDISGRVTDVQVEMSPGEVMRTHLTLVNTKEDFIDGAWDFNQGDVVVKCSHCGQWAAKKTACKYCGALV